MAQINPIRSHITTAGSNNQSNSTVNNSQKSQGLFGRFCALFSFASSNDAQARANQNKGLIQSIRDWFNGLFGGSSNDISNSFNNNTNTNDTERTSLLNNNNNASIIFNTPNNNNNNNNNSTSVGNTNVYNSQHTRNKVNSTNDPFALNQEDQDDLNNAFNEIDTNDTTALKGNQMLQTGHAAMEGSITGTGSGGRGSFPSSIFNYGATSSNPTNKKNSSPSSSVNNNNNNNLIATRTGASSNKKGTLLKANLGTVAGNLKQNKKQLGNIQNQSEDLKEGANNFLKMANQLKQQQQQQNTSLLSWFFGEGKS